MHTRSTPQRGPHGFTLLELLVAMTVLTILVVCVMQIMSSASATVTLSRKRIDADSAARLVFDRMAQDFSRMIQRPDVDVYFGRVDGPDQRNGVNDRMAFFADGRGYYSKASPAPTSGERSPVILTGYNVFTGEALYYKNRAQTQLMRLAKGLGWEPNGNDWQDLVFLPLTISTPTTAGDTNAVRWPQLFNTDPTTGDPSDGDFQLISESVFRLEYYFLLRDGSFSVIPITNPAGRTNSLENAAAPTGNDGAPTYSKGSRWYDRQHQKAYICVNPTANAAIWESLSMRDVAAVIVALAVLDPTSRIIVNNYTPLVESLPDASVTTTYDIRAHELSYYWNRVLNQQDASLPFPPNGVPKAAAGAVRTYQRSFYLNPSP